MDIFIYNIIYKSNIFNIKVKKVKSITVFIKMQKVLIDPEKPFENGEQTSLPGIMIQPKVAKKIPENERMSPNKKDNIEKESSRPTIILGELLVFGGVSLHKRRWVKYFSSSQRI